MMKETFTQIIHAKAKELKRTPNLLLFAVVTLAEKPEATEHDVFKTYFSSLSYDMEQAAKEQIKSSKKSIREAGEEALKGKSSVVNGYASSPLFGAAALEDLLDSKQVLNLHYVAWDHLTKDQLKIYKLAGKAKYSGKSLDAIQIIKCLCPELIEQAKKLAGLFGENDLNLN